MSRNRGNSLFGYRCPCMALYATLSRVWALSNTDHYPTTSNGSVWRTEPFGGNMTIADMERVSHEWPDGIHTCAELQQLEPGRRPCTCGRCTENESNAIYITADDMRNISTALGNTDAAIRLVRMFDYLSERYADETFKIKVYWR